MRWAILLLLALPILGCATPAPVREAAERERALLAAARERLEENRLPALRALDDLEDGAHLALMERSSLELSLAKAKLLEAMSSPFSDGSAVERREIALHHLFAVAEAEREVLDARLTERSEEIDRVRDAYAALLASMGDLLAAEEEVLGHLDRSPPRILLDAVDRAFLEAAAFRGRLEVSDDAEVRARAEALREKEERAREAWARLRRRVELAGETEVPR